MMAWWTSPIRLPGHGGGRSPPSTRPRCSTSTTRCRSARASAARCCAVRACTARIWRSGARPAMPAPAMGWHRRRRRSARASRSSWSGCGAATSVWRLSWPRRDRRSMSWENCTRSWKNSPRARTRTRSRRVDRRSLRRARRRHLDQQACSLLGASRATLYRRRHPPLHGPPVPRPAPPNKLTEAERQRVLTVLRSAEYCDLAPAQVWARLLDDGIYLCSISTMYRLLAVAGENRERRRQRTHPARQKPELIARRPNEVWSWDITKLQGPERGVYYELFVIIDIFSRYVVG